MTARSMRACTVIFAAALLAGCALGVDGGVLQRPPLSPRGASLTGHIGLGGTDGADPSSIETM